MKDKADFLPADKHQRFLQSNTIALVVLGQASHITQNNKFAISQQYFQKEVSDEVNFLYADKHERLLQIDTMILMGTRGRI